MPQVDGPTVRSLLRNATTATLATLDVATGHPYASLVEVATMPDLRPVLLLSGLARHTRNLETDPRASLLIDQRSVPSPLAAGRVALIGRLAPSDDPACKLCYLARFPEAATWATFADFRFWVMETDQAHLIAGFGRIVTLPGEAIFAVDDAGPAALAEG